MRFAADEESRIRVSNRTSATIASPPLLRRDRYLAPLHSPSDCTTHVIRADCARRNDRNTYVSYVSAARKPSSCAVCGGVGGGVGGATNQSGTIGSAAATGAGSEPAGVWTQLTASHTHGTQQQSIVNPPTSEARTCTAHKGVFSNSPENTPQGVLSNDPLRPRRRSKLSTFMKAYTEYAGGGGGWRPPYAWKKKNQHLMLITDNKSTFYSTHFGMGEGVL